MVKKNGKCKEYNLINGKIFFDGEYLNGLKNGKCKDYDTITGELKFDGEYLKGKKIKKEKKCFF